MRAQKKQQSHLGLVRNLKRQGDFDQIESRLKNENNINFNYIFHEPLGCYMLKTFLASIFSLSKIIFIADVNLYRSLWADSARKKVARLIFDRFIVPETPDGNIEESVFSRPKRFFNKFESHLLETTYKSATPRIISPENCNSIGYYDRDVISYISFCLESGENISVGLFDPVYKQIFDDLRFDIFPRFLQSEYYRNYIHLKNLETKPVSIADFDPRYTLGNGAFGQVNAARKKNTGRMYAIKFLSKKQVVASEQVNAVLNEQKFLSMMNSPFVTGLKYSFTDKEYLYLVLDLMPKGDLKQLLNRHGTFSEEVARFYTAEIVLGLKHIHDHGIIYRDIKLENILLDDKGHVKISDLGLSVMKERVKGYAGTPGYTAPEVIRGEMYTKAADFFSLGVIIYRFITGKKPYGYQGNDLDKNVLSSEPRYPPKCFSPEAVMLIKQLLVKNPEKRLGSSPQGIEEIMQHPWFAEVDFGLLDAGFVAPPWVPGESATPSHRDLDHPPHRNRYRKVRVPDAFNQKLGHFGFVSTSAVQTELVELMELMDRSKERLSSLSALSKVHKGYRGGCCSVM